MTSVTVGQATPTVIAETPSPDPATFGQSVTYAATVSGSGTTPSGTVAFTIGGTALCDGPLSAGSVSCMSAAAPVGSDQTVTATYSGDANYVGRIAVTSVTVDQATPTVAAEHPHPTGHLRTERDLCGHGEWIRHDTFGDGRLHHRGNRPVWRAPVGRVGVLHVGGRSGGIGSDGDRHLQR